MLDKLKKYNSISFVFEGVLDDEVNGEVNPKKEEFQRLVSELVKQGKYIWIFTKYHSQKTILSKELDLNERTKTGYKRIEEFISKVGIDKGQVLWSNRSAYKQLSDDRGHCHFDSSDYETTLMRAHKPSIKTINIHEENYNL